MTKLESEGKIKIVKYGEGQTDANVVDNQTLAEPAAAKSVDNWTDAREADGKLTIEYDGKEDWTDERIIEVAANDDKVSGLLAQMGGKIVEDRVVFEEEEDRAAFIRTLERLNNRQKTESAPAKKETKPPVSNAGDAIKMAGLDGKVSPKKLTMRLKETTSVGVSRIMGDSVSDEDSAERRVTIDALNTNFRGERRSHERSGKIGGRMRRRTGIGDRVSI